ncbi:MAG: glycosyltransferase family 2 protein [Crocinitomicaceae bacterium]|nr:glycosyltransferase family 2 protein [Crocinitomicaceae bacterium]MBK8925194.1 glycosyltransferase family 2 protein [Crocinitomicaceae bacterium]
MSLYLKKHAFCKPQISEPAHFNTQVIVVIPCFNEEKLLDTLCALALCDQPICHVEVIVVLNSGLHHEQAILDQNMKTQNEFLQWKKNNTQQNITWHLIHVANLPTKHAGVGLARKIGMDEAVARFEMIGADGIILCFDADSLCDKNYLTAVHRHFFELHPTSPGCSVYFEHPLNSDEYGEEIMHAITQYELHLRYYNLCMRYCRLPYAFHTIGSSMAVRSSAYQKQGGMNRRKAGEDFYFLHKIIALGNFSELNSTRVIPSPRVSDRVPFGTGKSVTDFLAQNQKQYYTYNFNSFQLISSIVKLVPQLRPNGAELIMNLFQNSADSVLLLDWLKQEKFDDALHSMRNNSASDSSFYKRFFAWFDAFRVLKLLHFLRDHGKDNSPVMQEISNLHAADESQFSFDSDPIIQLKILRDHERMRS